MLAAGAGTAVAGLAYLGIKGRRAVDVQAVDDEPELVPTWKETSGRDYGRDGYVFGDLSRGVIVRVFGKGGKTADVAAEAEGDAQFTQVQRLLREAVRLYRARGYCGSISLSHNVAYFNESVSLKVDGPGAGEALPWEKEDQGDVAQKLALQVANDAIASALTDDPASAASESAGAEIAKEGQAGYVFATLLARLERRAKSWQALSGVENLDPNLTQSAHIGFAIPVIKIGWGVSVSLTVSASSLLRWAEHEAAIAGATAE